MSIDEGAAPVDPRMKEYARRALALQVAGRESEAVNVLGEMGRALGGGNIYDLLICWVDTVIIAQGFVPDACNRVELTFVGPAGGPLIVDELPEPLVWAGRLISARLADDEDTLEALCSAVTPQSRPGNVLGVLRLAGLLGGDQSHIRDLHPSDVN